MIRRFVNGSPIRAVFLVLTASLSSLNSARALIPNPLSKRPSVSPASEIKVVFCGFGRHGTHSLSAALERLGFHPLHGEDLLEQVTLEQLMGIHPPTHLAIVDAMIDNDIPRILETTASAGYDATLEFHGFFWREIMEHYQSNGGGDSVRYIFALRDFDRWFDSYVDTYHVLRLLLIFPLSWIDVIRTPVAVIAAVVGNEFSVSHDKAVEMLRDPDTEYHRTARKRLYEQYTKEAMGITSQNPNALMVQLGKTSYKDLCDFLEISDCPYEEAFPRLRDRRSVTQTYYAVQLLRVMVILVPAGMIAVSIWILTKSLRWIWSKMGMITKDGGDKVKMN